MKKLIKYCILAMGLVGSNYPMKADVMTVARSFSSHHLNHHTMQEIWKDIPNYEGLYQASNLGRIKSLDRPIWIKINNSYGVRRGKINSLIKDNGYLYVNLSKNGKVRKIGVHGLVGAAFLGYEPRGRKIVINHINFNKADNSIKNLEVVTARENSNLKHIKSKSKYVGVHFRKNRNTWVSRITYGKKAKYLGSFKTEYEAHIAYQNELKTIS